MNSRRLCAFCASFFVILLGFVIVLISPFILRFFIKTKLVLSPDSPIFPLWNHFPHLVPMDIYLFNWTNPTEIYNKSVKPKFQEVGPFRFMVDLHKSNVTWNENGTVTFKINKYWYYQEEESRGRLDDEITMPNPVSLSAAHVARNWNYIVRNGLSLTLKGLVPSIHITHTANELLFEGYNDVFLKIAKTLPFFINTEMPAWEKFGWFYKRNGSTDFDGVYNMGTGVNSTFGELYSWNYWSKTPYFDEACANVRSTTGERFAISDSNNQFIEIFSPDLCRPVTLQFAEESEVYGVNAYKYVLGDYTLDNGTKYLQNKCFCNGECRPSGIFNVSSCRWGTPAFASLPHFYKADPYYSNLIEGTKSDKGKHEFSVVVEPNTGVALEVKIRLQVNLMLHEVPSITMYENIPEVFVPIMWFDYQVTMPEEQASTLKHLLNISFVCAGCGIFISILGIVLSVYLVFIQRRKRLALYEDEPLKIKNKDEIVMKKMKPRNFR